MEGSGHGSDTAADALRAVLDDPRHTLLAADFDGTLSPIVEDPDEAYALPEAVLALGRLGRHLGQIAIVTGRPALRAAELGHFRSTPGLESMVVLGQYGVERWEAETDSFQGPPQPEEIVHAAEEIPGLLDRAGLSEARVENKGRALGVHTRELDRPSQAFSELEPPLRELADRYGLRLEPGKHVLELRVPGTDKGDAIRALVRETRPTQLIFLGDDLGDVPAFQAVRAMRSNGLVGLLVCSASAEQDALAAMADVVVDGPGGVATWLAGLAERLEGTEQPT